METNADLFAHIRSHIPQFIRFSADLARFDCPVCHGNLSASARLSPRGAVFSCSKGCEGARIAEDLGMGPDATETALGDVLNDNADVTQWTESRVPNAGVPGSNPGVGNDSAGEGSLRDRAALLPDSPIEGGPSPAEQRTQREASGAEPGSAANQPHSNQRQPGDEASHEAPHENDRVATRSARPSPDLPANGRPSVFSWKIMLYELGKRGADELIAKDPLNRAAIEAQEIDAFVSTVERLRNLPAYWQTNDPEGLSASEIEEEVHSVALALQKHYLPVVQNGNGHVDVVPARALTVIRETAEQAVVSNAEYLSRSAIIARLLYTHHGSLHVGGKHEGKTTATKTEALAVATATSTTRLWGRDVEQTPVIYAASEDEYPSVRMDLLRMGWNPSVPLYMVKIADKADRDFVLEDIAKMALELGVYYVILDMLFDFLQVQDEIKYAHTRDQTAGVIQLSTAIKGHVKSTHHSPKWMPDAATAAKAALGSQGIAARFSPVILSRMWVEPKLNGEGELLEPGLFTIESTMTRDPRGLAIPATVITRDEMGWVSGTEPFRSAMKWPLYVERIRDFFEMAEPGKRFSAQTVAKELAIPKPECQNAMLRMCQGDRPILERMHKLTGQGGGYTYGLCGRNSLTRPS